MNIALVFWFLGFGITTYSGVLANQQCSRNDLDIFIVLDGSQSIGNLDFQRLREFLSNLVGKFRIGQFESRVGLMQFSNKYRTVIEFDFGKHKTTKAVQQNLKALVHQYGNATHAGNALKLVNKHVFPGQASESGPPDAEKILLFITDGQPHDPEVALVEADKLKKKGVHLITVGAGTEKWISRFKLLLNRIGSKPTHNHRQGFKSLGRIIQKLVKDMCGSKERQPAPPHKCFQEKRDIVIMMDGSRSIGKRNFLKIRSFLVEFISHIDVGPSRVHVSIIQFSESRKTSIEIALSQYLAVKELVEAVAKIMYHQGEEADLFSALKLVDLQVLNGAGGDRISAPDTLIIITNGNYKDEGVSDALAKLRKKKVQILSVAVSSKGRDVKQGRIDALAIGSGDVYDLTTLEAAAFIEDITPSTCKMTSCTTGTPKCSPENQDIVFLLDGTAQIGSRHFQLGLRFVRRLITKMTLGNNATRVGVIQYGSTGQIKHVSRLNKDNLESLVINEVSRMVYMDEGRGSDLAYALSIASDMLLNPSEKDRESVSKTIVLITDGRIKDFAEVNSMAKTVRNKGIRIIALSNGASSNYRTHIASLRLIASGDEGFYQVDNSKFNDVLKELQKTVCVSRPQIPETCFTQKRRVFFALDSSSGRGRKKFQEVKDFMENLVTKLQIGISNSQVGFLQYDDLTTTKSRIVFEKTDTAEEILQRIQNMKYRKGTQSFLGNALRIVNEEVFPRKTDYDGGYKDLLIIIGHKEITDAQTAFDQAEKLKEKGVEIISIATGNRKKIEKIKSQLQVISTISTNTRSADYKSLWTVTEDVLVNVCGLGQCTSLQATTCTPKKQDIVFVIDSSRSIGDMNYRRLKRFTKRLTSRLDLAEDRTHLGLLQVGKKKDTHMEFDMGEFPDRSDVLYMIGDMTYMDSTMTFMGDGLKTIREKVFNGRGRDRSDVPNTVVIFADGHAHDGRLMLREAEKLKEMGVNILAVGYGTNVTEHRPGMKNLKRMASNHRDVFSIDFENNDLVLEEKVEVIAKHLVQVDCPRAYRPPVQCVQGFVDLFLLVDGSRSINSENFKLVKKFLRKLTAEFDISKTGTHVGLMQFSDEKSLSYEFALNRLHSNKEVKKAIRRMKYRAGTKTNTGDALRIVNRYIFNHQNGDRPNATDVLILFTDGQAHDFAIARKHAEEMKQRNIRIVTIAAGPDAKNPKAKLARQMEALASDPLNVYRVDFSELNDIVDHLIDIDCFITPPGKGA